MPVNVNDAYLWLNTILWNKYSTKKITVKCENKRDARQKQCIIKFHFIRKLINIE
jgi:hypothetical protein